MQGDPADTVVREGGAICEFEKPELGNHSTSLAFKLQSFPNLLIPYRVCTPSFLTILTSGDKRKSGNVCLLGVWRLMSEGGEVLGRRYSTMPGDSASIPFPPL